jgi:hypothetical protein
MELSMRARRICAAVTLAFALQVMLPSPSQARASRAWPEVLEARLSAGYDSNLLDASDADRSAFALRDPESFFVVNSMRDGFLEAGVAGEWRFPRLLAGRPTLRLGYQRRQYFDNPIKSSDDYTLDGTLRLAAATRVDLGLEFQPQIYQRHRRDDNALPGEPEFRPEVLRRTDMSAGLTQRLRAGTSLKAGLRGSLRDTRAPFDARDRRLFGGDVGIAQALPRGARFGLSGGYARTRSRNDPASPTDLSNREWTLSSWLEARSNRMATTLGLWFQLGWRHYASSEPADGSHFGRVDNSTALELRLTRDLGGALAWVTRLAPQSRTANIQVGSADDGAFSDAEIQSGIRWSHSLAKQAKP